MNFKQQTVKDLENILMAEEISDVVVLGTGDNAIEGRAVLNMSGQSEAEWGGGSSMTATAVLPKYVFTEEPKIHDFLFVEGGRTYRIDSIVNESSVAWTVQLVSDLKAR